MAPTAMRQESPSRLLTKTMPPGSPSLEVMSDAIDEVNALRDAGPASASASASGSVPPPTKKSKAAFRQYETACERVRDFYREQHTKQTVAYNVAARARFDDPRRARPQLTVWEALERLDTIVDASDPDTALSQSQHLVQTAEALRRDGKPRWMQLVGLIHDLGKLMLVLFDDDDDDDNDNSTINTSSSNNNATTKIKPQTQQRQWNVVGDTFPVGCAFDRRIVLAASTFHENPDAAHAVYGTALGIYGAGCGLDRILLSWGHDEYLYRVVRDQSRLPPAALAVIRYHSFYPWHRDGAYRALMAPGDWHLLRAVREFNPYDLYSKAHEPPPALDAVRPYYSDLIDEFFPQRVLKW